ncbi:MAG: ATP-binding protein [Chromatiales bacterium]|nr:ATP-binding protein [Chromatiales bacterium]
MTPSIRSRLLAILLGVITLVWIVTIIMSYHETQHEIEELFDAQLAQSARTLMAVAGHELAELDGIPDVAHIHFLPEELGGHEYEYKLAYQLWIQPQNRLILRSYKSPEQPLSQLTNGYSTESINEQRWRIFSLTDPDSGYQVMMGESLEIRQELSREIATRLALPMLIALPLLAMLIALGINRGLRPLQQLAKTITRRDPAHLERVETLNAPTEIAPILHALNQLFERVEEGLEQERRFTADAAHELRTPLAALKVQAQVAQRSGDSEERQRALKQLTSGIDRTSHLIEQLLTLARLEPKTAQKEFSTFSLRPIAEEVIISLEPAATAKQIELQLKCDEESTVYGQPDAITIALRNLVDNAIRYTPQGGNVELAITTQDNQVTLSVSDSGPGIAEEERKKIFNRFYRLAGQEVEGSGLGLSIVQRVVELHGGESIIEESMLGGTKLSITLKWHQPVGVDAIRR